MLSSYIVDFLLICIITLCYLTLYTDPQLKIAIFWSSKTIVLCGALRVKKGKLLIDRDKFIPKLKIRHRNVYKTESR